MKQDARWPDAHINLKRLYDERVPDGVTQADFGRQFGIGTQGMVWQYLSGHRPLNYEAAAKFARGLRCTILDISPQMAEALKSDIVPVLGPRAWLRAGAKALIALAILSGGPQPQEARAGFNISSTEYTLRAKRRWWWWLLELIPPRLEKMRAVSQH